MWNFQVRFLFFTWIPLELGSTQFIPLPLFLFYFFGLVLPAPLFCFLHLQKDQNRPNYCSNQPPNTIVPHLHPTTQHHHYTQTPETNTINDHGVGKKAWWSQDNEGGGKCDPIPKRIFWNTLFFFFTFWNSFFENMLT